jgi:hypothetical protein
MADVVAVVVVIGPVLVPAGEVVVWSSLDCEVLHCPLDCPEVVVRVLDCCDAVEPESSPLGVGSSSPHPVASAPTTKIDHTRKRLLAMPILDPLEITGCAAKGQQFVALKRGSNVGRSGRWPTHRQASGKRQTQKNAPAVEMRKSLNQAA